MPITVSVITGESIPVGGLSTCVLALRVLPRELPSCHTLKPMGSRVWAYHLLLSPMRVGSKTPVFTLRKAMLEGVMDHSARNSTACQRPKRFPA